LGLEVTKSAKVGAKRNLETYQARNLFRF